LIKSVISDLGKVLIFFDNNIFFEKMADYCPFSGKEISAMVSEHLSIIELMDTGKISPRVFYKKVTEILSAEINYSTFFSIYNNIFSLNPPVLKVMKILKPEYRLVLLSNTDIMRFNFVKKKFPEAFIFDEYVLSFEVGYVKPHPKIFEKALEKAEAEAFECVFIDDRKENVEFAQTLGMHTVHFRDEIELERELRGKGLFLSLPGSKLKMSIFDNHVD